MMDFEYDPEKRFFSTIQYWFDIHTREQLLPETTEHNLKESYKIKELIDSHYSSCTTNLEKKISESKLTFKHSYHDEKFSGHIYMTHNIKLDPLGKPKEISVFISNEDHNQERLVQLFEDIISAPFVKTEGERVQTSIKRIQYLINKEDPDITEYLTLY
ncbi:MAG: hypothetical protein KC535_01305 [Nanoarchaeota archaeon]|nr:hypothetical protein [Nanoarchaeota archaeon]